MFQLQDRRSGDTLANAPKISNLEDAYSTYSKDMLGESYLRVKNDLQVADTGGLI